MTRRRSTLATSPALLVALTLVMGAPGSAPAQVRDASAPAPPTDSAAVVAAVHAFHQALETGDTAAVRGLLAEDAVVGEGGGLETRGEYLSGHMGADMAFAAAVTREARPVRVRVVGDVAWVASTSRTTGTWRERPVDSRGAETMILGRDGGAWRIRAIHWSSGR